LDGGEIAALALPADPFPSLAPAEVPPVEEAGPLVREALDSRADLRAARERRERAAVLLVAAENALRPQLDVIFTPSYSGLEEGSGAGSFFSPLYRNVPGLSSSLALSLALPLANNQARGQLLQTQSAVRQNDLVVELLAKGIGADVPTALDAVGRNALQLDRAREAERLFERAVVNEEKKLRAGTSTLLDVISQRDRLTAARQGEVSAQLALALSLLDLRFLTGTLLAADGDASVVESSRLTTLPEREGETP
jgi:outer membrane protein TolC